MSKPKGGKKSKRTAARKAKRGNFGPNTNQHGHFVLCVAEVTPKCRKKSGGPRFRYLCRSHRQAGIGFGKVGKAAAERRIQRKRPTKKAT